VLASTLALGRLSPRSVPVALLGDSQPLATPQAGKRFIDRRQGVAVLDDTLLESVRAVFQAVNFVVHRVGIVV
jgi:hypothetical protein